MLRRRVGRGYRWVGRTFGWSTIIYLVFWIGLFVVGGVQSAAPIERPLPVAALPIALDVMALLALVSVSLQRSPPVVLGRSHAMLLGLAPWPARRVLRPRLLGFFASRVFVGAVVGTAAWLLVTILFAVSAPALVALGAGLWLLRAALALLVYERRRFAVPLALLASLLAALGAASGALGWEQGTAAPALAAGAFTAFGLVAAALALTVQGDAYPEGYLFDAMVVAEFRASVLMAVMTQRLGAVAWRSALGLLRAPLLMKIALLAALGYVYATLSAGVVGGLPLAVLGLAAGFLASWLLGPSVEPAPVPLDPFSRGAGRALPGLVAAGAVFVLLVVVRSATGGSAGSGEAGLLAFALVALATVTLEKASSWLHVSHREWTAWGLSGLLSGTLLWILSALGGPGAITIGALALAFFSLLALP
ncbi:MAG: hypothetical protein P8Y13_13215 [Deinococcales bacterium]